MQIRILLKDIQYRQQDTSYKKRQTDKHCYKTIKRQTDSKRATRKDRQTARGLQEKTIRHQESYTKGQTDKHC